VASVINVGSMLAVMLGMFPVGFMNLVLALAVMLGVLHVPGMIHHLVGLLIGRVFVTNVPPMRGMVHGLMLDFFIVMFAMLLRPALLILFTHRPISFLIA
jgi:hypothetical protein